MNYRRNDYLALLYFYHRYCCTDSVARFTAATHHPNLRMRTQPYPGTSILCLLLAGATAQGGTFSTSAWTGDADSGISTTINYTAKADFNGDGTRVINGVNFTTGAPIASS